MALNEMLLDDARHHRRVDVAVGDARAIALFDVHQRLFADMPMQPVVTMWASILREDSSSRNACITSRVLVATRHAPIPTVIVVLDSVRVLISCWSRVRKERSSSRLLS